MHLDEREAPQVIVNEHAAREMGTPWGCSSSLIRAPAQGRVVRIRGGGRMKRDRGVSWKAPVVLGLKRGVGNHPPESYLARPTSME